MFLKFQKQVLLMIVQAIRAMMTYTKLSHCSGDQLAYISCNKIWILTICDLECVKHSLNCQDSESMCLFNLKTDIRFK